MDIEDKLYKRFSEAGEEDREGVARERCPKRQKFDWSYLAFHREQIIYALSRPIHAACELHEDMRADLKRFLGNPPLDQYSPDVMYAGVLSGNIWTIMNPEPFSYTDFLVSPKELNYWTRPEEKEALRSLCHKLAVRLTPWAAKYKAFRKDLMRVLNAPLLKAKRGIIQAESY